MNRNKNRTTEEDKDKKESNNNNDVCVRILQSSTCRRLFWGANDPIPSELSKEAREQQRLRWNFDFMTETPLPGRYQWERIEGPKNGDADTNKPCEGPSKRSRSPSETQCPRPEKQARGGNGVGEGSRDRSIHDTHVPTLHINDVSSTYGVDCT